jgi:hypothetical protein
MTRGEAWLLRGAHAALAVSGLAWAWMKWIAASADPYSRVAHPWQPSAQAAHLLAAPVFLLAIGLIWRGHAWARIRARFPARRRSGIALALLLLPAAASGYLLQVAVAPAARAFRPAAHVAACLLWLGAWVAHRRPRRAAPATGT